MARVFGKLRMSSSDTFIMQVLSTAKWVIVHLMIESHSMQSPKRKTT